MEIKLYNTLTRKKETFKPTKKGHVSMYSCGPTVYWYQHIGNLRTALLNDLLKRTLEYNNLKVKHVMNITDVDDKTIKASQEEKVSLKELTSKYEEIFLSDLKKLNIISPNILPRATENIDEMISMIQTLLDKKIAYKASDGIYFSIDKCENYGQLACLNLESTKKSRISGDEYDKENQGDFALWKFHTEEDGPVSWQAPFGKGRPGWHIECSAMSKKNLGDTFDIHTGGTDLTFPHHTNEIAQSECATGKKFVNYWVHGAFLNMKEEKMSKSKGNILTLKALEDQDFQPLAYRYLILQTHYRKELKFSIDSLEAATNALENLKKKIIALKSQDHKGSDHSAEYEKQFHEAINDDLNIPKALSVFIKALDDLDFSPKKKLSLLEKFDSVLGLNISSFKAQKIQIPQKIQNLAEKREHARSQKDFTKADQLRDEIQSLGFSIEDSPEGPILSKK